MPAPDRLQQAIDIADDHVDAVKAAKNLTHEFTTLLFSVGVAKAEGSPRFHEQVAKLHVDLAAFHARFAELTATANHDLANAEQAVVILRSGVAA